MQFKVPRAPGEREWNLFLAASCADSQAGLARTQPFLGPSVDWEEVLRLAERHGTDSLLYQSFSRMPDLIPTQVIRTLRERYEINVRKALFLTRELTRIADCLDSLGIEAVHHKGLVLSEIYYGDMALRQCGDIDLYVRKKDVARTKQAVGEMGYTAAVAIAENAQDDYLDSGYECSFDSAVGRNVLELQWALQPRFFAVDFDMEGLFARAVNVTFAERQVRTPSSEDLLLVLSLHAAKHVWGRLIWLCDIAQILKREKLDWDWVQSRAREMGTERILHITLLLTERLLQTEIPLPIQSAVVADRSAGVLVDEIQDRIIRGIGYEEEKISYFRLMMRLRERRVNRLRFLTRLTFTPGPGEWETIRLPKILFPLYRVVRLARLAGRLVRG
jgi:hypothetical protein